MMWARVRKGEQLIEVVSNLMNRGETVDDLGRGGHRWAMGGYGEQLVSRGSNSK